MASIDSQNYSPLLEKRNFKDLLEDDMVAVEEDLITKIFSQTVQVSPSEEVPEPYAQIDAGGGAVAKEPQLEQPTHGNDAEEVIVDAGEEVQTQPVDKVPTDFSHFNQTIVDNDEADDVVDHYADEEPFIPIDSEAITLAATECVDEIIGELEEHINHNPQAITPSTASPVDHEEEEEDEEDPVDDQLLSEIRDFEEIERITEVSPEKEVVHLMCQEEPMIAQEEEEITPDIETVQETTDQEDVQIEDLKAQEMTSNINDEYKDHQDCDESNLTKLATETTGVVQQSESRKTTVTTKIVSSTTSVQQQESSEVVETMTEESTVLKKDRKSKKVKKGKENISVVPRIDDEEEENEEESPQAVECPSIAAALPVPEALSLPQPLAPTIGIFCSVRELSKLYEEKHVISRPRRPFIKEDIMQINLNVKNMCRSFLDLTQYSATAPLSGGALHEKHPASGRSLNNGHGPSDKKLLFQRSKSITDLRRIQHHHQHLNAITLGKGVGNREREDQEEDGIGSAATFISRQFSSSVFFLQKLLYFENWRRCVGSVAAAAVAADGNENEPCKQVHCPHCNSLSSKSSLPPKKIRISIMQFDMKSSFSKFDALQKKAAAAAAAAAAQPHVNGSSGAVPALLGQEQNSVRCTACDKVVYQMEQMKAENRFWHKNCFRCTTCNKPLAVDSYQSHESILYCKPHFKQLFSPKTVLDAEDIEVAEKKGPEMIIRESQPTALPEGVVRATDKVEDGLTLDDLHRLKNVKQAFEMFEKHQDSESRSVELSSHKVEKSPSIINKLAQFQKKISREANRARRKGVPADDLHGEPQEGNLSDSSSCYSSGDDEPPEGVDVDLWRSRKATNKSDPIQHCTDLDDLKKKFESNDAELERRERQEERREEIKRIRSRLFMGKQAKIKEQYQQAVADSEFVVENQNGSSRRPGDAVLATIKDKMQQLGEGGDEQAVNTTKQKLLDMKSENLIELEELRRQKQRDNLEIKSKFESGIEKSPSYNRGADDPELMAQMVEKGIAKMSRNIFLEIDKQAAQQTGPKSPIALQPTNLRKSASMVQQSPPAEVVNKTANGGDEGENGVDGGVVIDTKDLQKKFAFFEKYQEQDRSPKKTINVTKFKDTSAVKEMFENNQQNNSRRQESVAEDMAAVESNTTKKMLNLFRDIESGANKQQPTDGRRPLKTFTPPPDGGRRLYDAEGNENEDQENDDSDPGVTDNSDIESEDEEVLKKRIGKYDDEILERAKKEARAQKLRAKFERWETEQIRMEQEAAAADQGRREYLDPTQLESATNLRDKFEFMSKGDSQTNSPRKVMVNRFV